ncbi:MAG: SWIM zinc finger family protein [Deinococcus sp.]|uniref:SWIM zinc finger family protein n=1 Tax=Deinococcus sp. TaxID=47478 RepID=UPI0026DBAB32|nr:SWIM zinc finger family protein [Deinococcus sp.]MDO4245742.1 SWIM zinc finger family protein [Deinococcus sp.]
MSSVLLSQQAALDWVGEREWRKGQSYVRGLTGLTRQPDGTLTLLQGSAHGQEKYIVRVTLAGKEVEAAHCSCPVGEAGACKHVAALLARALQSPQDFNALEDLQSQLERLDAPALRALIRDMLQQEPELRGLLLTRPGRTAKGTAADLDKRIAQAFALVDYDAEYDWEGEGPDLSDLEPLLDTLRGQVHDIASLDAAGYADLYRAADAMLEGCADLNDDDYDLGLWEYVTVARTALLRLLQQPVDSLLRENILDTLEESIGQLRWDRKELQSGQLELFSALPAEEREQLRAFVTRLQGLERHEAYRHRWAQTLYLLFSPEETNLEDELALARATGRPQEVIKAMLKHGQTESALQQLNRETKAVPPQELESAFAEHGLLPQLEEYARQHLKTFGVRAWLYGHYRDTGRHDEAHALARDAVLKGTGDHAFYIARWNGQLVRDPDWLSELRHISPDWPADRAEYVRQQWKKAGQTDSLLNFLLEEGLLSEAQKLVSERSEVRPELLTRLALSLSAEDAKPLVLRAVLAHVSGRGREHYRAAAETLTQTAALIGQDEAREVARLLTQQFPKLSALRDELRRAKLLRD